MAVVFGIISLTLEPSKLIYLNHTTGCILASIPELSTPSLSCVNKVESTYISKLNRPYLKCEDHTLPAAQTSTKTGIGSKLKPELDRENQSQN